MNLSKINLAVESSKQNLLDDNTKVCYRDTHLNGFWQEWFNTLLLFVVGVVFHFGIKNVSQLAY